MDMGVLICMQWSGVEQERRKEGKKKKEKDEEEEEDEEDEKEERKKKRRKRESKGTQSRGLHTKGTRGELNDEPNIDEAIIEATDVDQSLP